MRAFILWLLSIQLQLSVSWAGILEDQCRDKHIDESSMGSVRDQGQTGLCFAYASAALLSFYAGRRVSALAVAINHHRYRAQFEPTVTDKQKNKELFQLSDPSAVPINGWPHSAIDGARHFGICTEDSIRSFLRSFKLNSGDGPGVYSPAEINSIYDILNSIHDEAKYSKTKECQENDLTYQLVFKSLPIEKIKEILKRAHKQSRWGSLIDAACKRIHIPKLDLKAQRKLLGKTPNALSTELNSLLSSNAPVVINLERSELDSLAVNGQQKIGRRWVNPHSDHSALVVGRRWNPQKGCEFRIRDTDSVPCRKGWAERFRCEAGYFWLTAEEVDYVTDELDYLKKPEKR